MKNADNHTRNIIILICIGVGVLILGVFAFLQNSSLLQSNEPPKQTEYVDPVSGEVIQDTEGKTPEQYGVDSAQPMFLGFGELLDRGMQLEDVDSVKVFLTDYVKKQMSEGKDKIDRMSIEKDSVQHAIDQKNYKERFSMKLVTDKSEWYVLEITTDTYKRTRVMTLKKDKTTVFSATQKAS